MINCPNCQAALPVSGAPPQGVTKAQTLTLDFVAKVIVNGGVSPTVREIMAGTGRNSPGAIHQQLIELKKRGFLHRGPRGARPLSLTDKTWQHYAPKDADNA